MTPTEDLKSKQHFGPKISGYGNDINDDGVYDNDRTHRF